MKARGIGFSEINAAICACIYNCFSESNCFVPKYKLNGKVIYGNCYKSEPETFSPVI